MSDKKISQLTASTTPLAGTEVLPIVQSGVTKKVAVADLTAGRAISVLSADIVADAGASDGYVQRVFQGATLLGEIGIGAGGQAIYFGQGSTNLLPLNSQNSLIPRGANGAARSGAISLGTGTNKFLDLYLAGNVIVDAGKGIDFSADPNAGGMTSELLDDYEEGTWTPTYVTTGVDFDSVTYHGSVFGTYTKVGRQVMVVFFLRTSAITVGSATGNVRVGGLPFSAASSSVGSASITIANWAGDQPLTGASVGNQIALNYRTSVNGRDFLIDVADMATGVTSNDLVMSLTYFV